MATPIGTLGTIPSLQIGGRVYTDLTSLIILGADATAGRWGTMRLCSGTAGYQVTTGKTLTISSVAANSPAGGGSSVYGTILYGNTDVGFQSASAPTSPVYMFGSSTVFPILGAFAASGASVSNYKDTAININFAVPATKYPALENSGGAEIFMIAYGYEA